ncbi:hypothetical protein OG539_36790 [Actinacidiphila glaucinigra]|uniref:hypothetical protein n=1 Tax=Actinacidiphila glaucinigra TaxID=235986 RepID=UPI0032488BC2
MEWLVRPLREAGLRVLALDHHGNNFVDGYEPEGFLHVWERPRDVSFAHDELAGERALGPVGAAGFSLGAHTAVALAGARLDTDVLWAVLSGAVPLPDIPRVPRCARGVPQEVPRRPLGTAGDRRRGGRTSRTRGCGRSSKWSPASADS